METIIQSALLGIGFVGIIILLLTRFMKTGFIITLISFLGYFYFLDINSWFPIILLVLGILLIIFEAFIPDFGLLGLLGLAAFVGGIYLSTGDWLTVFQDLSLAFIIAAVTTYFLVKSGLATNRWQSLVLSTSEPEKETPKIEEENVLHIGQIGETMTPLRPTGFAKFTFPDGNTKEVDVTSEIESLERGTKVRIENIKGNKIIVRSVS